MFPDHDPLVIDLMEQMLKFDPAKRITVEDALKHPYLRDFHDESDEPSTDLVSAFEFDFEFNELEGEDYRKLVLEEIMLYHDENARNDYESRK